MSLSTEPWLRIILKELRGLSLGFACWWLAITSCLGSDAAALRGRAMGTTWSVKFVQPAPSLDTSAVAQGVSALLERLEQQFSTYRPASELSRFNAQRDTNWFTVSPELALVTDEARAISELTGGAFDVTVAPLVNLWGFGPRRRETIPANAEIAAARAHVGWRRLEVRRDPPALRKIDPQLTADFSGIAKGFAVDELAAHMESCGVTNFLIGLAGEQRARGMNEAGRPWRVGVERAEADTHAIELAVEPGGLALSTSGDYRNFFTVNGRRFSHLIDPRNGWPVSNSLASVSVAHASSATADALATGLFVLGAEDGFRVATAHRLACLLLIRDGARIIRKMTPEFERLVVP